MAPKGDGGTGPQRSPDGQSLWGRAGGAQARAVDPHGIGGSVADPPDAEHVPGDGPATLNAMAVPEAHVMSERGHPADASPGVDWHAFWHVVSEYHWMVGLTGHPVVGGVAQVHAEHCAG
ncbi:MAG TPA: hypothetical protein VIJ22_10250, partial [Polyangiaceae bacterium]